MRYILIFIFCLTLCISCQDEEDITMPIEDEMVEDEIIEEESEEESEEDEVEDDNIIDTIPNTEALLDQLKSEFTLLPEGRITISNDERVIAAYINPTPKYGHGILGDRIEAEGIAVVVDTTFFTLALGDDYVYEDIRPRLYDVDGDGELEIITIRTHLSQGAGIVIYKIEEEQIIEYATVVEIGRSNRWLNIVAIDDVDNDGVVELVWIQTPHIGGILKIAKINEGPLEVISGASQYSNHAIGQRNLCLSVVTEHSNRKVIFVPSQNRDKIVGFTFENNTLNQVEEFSLEVDFALSLRAQYAFDNPIEDAVNCITE